MNKNKPATTEAGDVALMREALLCAVEEIEIGDFEGGVSQATMQKMKSALGLPAKEFQNKAAIRAEAQPAPREKDAHKMFQEWFRVQPAPAFSNPTIEVINEATAPDAGKWDAKKFVAKFWEDADDYVGEEELASAAFAAGQQSAQPTVTAEMMGEASKNYETCQATTKLTWREFMAKELNRLLRQSTSGEKP